MFVIVEVPMKQLLVWVVLPARPRLVAKFSTGFAVDTMCIMLISMPTSRHRQ